MATKSSDVEGGGRRRRERLENMGFVGVYTAIYDYAPQGEGELDIKEGNLLYVLDTDSEDGWWKVKKKAEREDEDEPEGLVPNNYIEEVRLFSSLLPWFAICLRKVPYAN